MKENDITLNLLKILVEQVINEYQEYSFAIERKDYEIFFNQLRNGSFNDRFKEPLSSFSNEEFRKHKVAYYSINKDHGIDFYAQVLDTVYKQKIDPEHKVINRIVKPYPANSRLGWKNLNVVDIFSDTPIISIFKMYGGIHSKHLFPEIKAIAKRLLTLRHPELININKYIFYFEQERAYKIRYYVLNKDDEGFFEENFSKESIRTVESLKDSKQDGQIEKAVQQYDQTLDLIYPSPHYYLSNKQRVIDEIIPSIKITKGRKNAIGNHYDQFSYKFSTGDKYWTDEAMEGKVQDRFWREILEYEYLVKSMSEEVQRLQSIKNKSKMQETKPSPKKVKKGRRAEAYELNREIEKMIDDLGFDPSAYTTEAKEFIKGYTGYGGLQDFDVSGDGILYEYYTPVPIIEKMWALAIKHGFKGGNVLEPSAGIGDFIGHAPSNLKMHFTAIELKAYSSNIIKILYPGVTVKNQYFEQEFISRQNKSVKGKVNQKYSLVIGNPPYGSIAGLSGGKYMNMGEKKHTKAKNYDEYFIKRSLDLLLPGGLIVFIIGAEVANGGKPFLDKGWTDTKRMIAEESELLEAYRLPNGVFDRTDVLSDIIVIKKNRT